MDVDVAFLAVCRREEIREEHDESEHDDDSGLPHAYTVGISQRNLMLAAGG
jgi:hypothetical protein